VTEWRRRALEQAMLNAGLSAQDAAGAEAAMENFAHWRSRIDVPQETHDTLAKLAEKWPLVAITNGNAQPELFGLSDYFASCCAPVRTGARSRLPICTIWRRRSNLPLGRFCTWAMI
jgi:putative hydrolase of the HAD superfamily